MVKNLVIRKCILSFLVFFFLHLTLVYSQSPLVKELSDAVTELTGSFLDNPYNHNNTLKVFDLTKKFKKATDDLYNEALRSNHSQAEIDLKYIKNIQAVLKTLDFLVGSISGYLRGGLNVEYTENILHPLLDSFGWTWEITHVAKPDLVFYEYKKGSFKMVLVKNTRPQKDYDDYNVCTYECYTWEPVTKTNLMFTMGNVCGGNYIFVENGDSEIPFKNITKVSSKRK
ncbi:MAG: hypothetical protein IKN83_02370 [Bacteroidaceae bacterium]|nr:hypothetical protein [Bacteroidaceae bacterium]